jgi:hypothetical protein
VASAVVVELAGLADAIVVSVIFATWVFTAVIVVVGGWRRGSRLRRSRGRRGRLGLRPGIRPRCGRARPRRRRGRSGLRGRLLPRLGARGGRGRGRPAALPAPRPTPALGAVTAALGAVTAAVGAVPAAVALVGRAQLDWPDGGGIMGCDRDSHRSDRDRAEGEPDAEQDHGARCDSARFAPPGGVINETVLMIIVMRVGHAPRERWADRVKGL